MSSMSVPSLSSGQLPLLEGRPLSDAGSCNGQSHDDGRQQLQTLHRYNLGVKDNGVDKPVDHGADHHRQHALGNGPAAQNRFTDDEAGQADDHDAGAGVDVHRLLILAHHGPGEGRQGVGYAQSYRDGECRVQGRGPHHVGIIACGPDGKAHACFQKCQQQYARQNGDRSRQHPVRCRPALPPAAKRPGYES